MTWLDFLFFLFRWYSEVWCFSRVKVEWKSIFHLFLPIRIVFPTLLGLRSERERGRKYELLWVLSTDKWGSDYYWLVGVEDETTVKAEVKVNRRRKKVCLISSDISILTLSPFLSRFWFNSKFNTFSHQVFIGLDISRKREIITFGSFHVPISTCWVVG